MSRKFDAKHEALAAYPDDAEAALELFLDYLDISEDDFRYEEGMSASEYLYGKRSSPPNNPDNEGERE